MLAGLLGRPGNVFAAIENWMDNPSEAWKETPFIEDTLQLHDGGTINVRVSPVIMGDSFLGTVYVYRDTTKEVDADRMEDDFVANVTHEFRTPITSVKGYIDLLLMGTAGEVSASQKPLLQSIKTDVDRLAALINDVLDLSRIDDATFEMSFKSVAVDRLFAGAADELQLKIDHAGRPMTVEVVPVDDMPPIRADLNRIQQIIRILLDNAFNYTPENGHIRLSATHDVDTEEVILTVADDGRGMPEEMHPRVFERFFRGEDYDAQIADTPGTGLGLAIAKSLTEAQNGSISFESKLGEGSTFYVRMPALTED